MQKIEVFDRIVKGPSQSGSREVAARMPLLGVDVLRHLLTLAVIYQHMMSRSRYSDVVTGEINHWVPLIDGAVGCFFLLSGYFSRAGMNRHRIIGMARRLMLPYFLFSLVYAVALGAMGKLAFSEAVLRTFTFAGVGPQLYFLPYLLVVSVGVTLAIDLAGPRFGKAATCALMAGLFLVYLALPTDRSTGSDPRLFAFYGLAYAWGVYRARYASEAESLIVAAGAAILLIALPWTWREWDVAVIVVLAEAALRASVWMGRAVRLPGSGGVYLLHTPILNYAISIACSKMGIEGMANVMLALSLTYLVALAATLIAIRAFPRLRPYLLE